MEGKLFIIGTPIGNLKDITLRALEVIDKLDVLACEDTRVAAKLINHYMSIGFLHNRPEYVTYNDFNEKYAWESLVTQIEQGKKVGLVSDAGMPLVSDPGYRLVKACIERKISFEVIPGVSSVTTALVKSGFGGENFLFLGFLPKKPGKRERTILSIKESLDHFRDLRVVIFLSPHRLAKELVELENILGAEIPSCLCRELTKRFEERIELELGKLREHVSGKKIKGELVLVLSNKE